MAFGAVLLFTTLLSTSRTNALHREEYSTIRRDLAALQQDGRLPQGALIVSPAHGLPYEWSNPFELDRPVPAYLDTGWITFSPSYMATLAAFNVTSLPDALYSRNDILLMTQEDFTPFLSRYYAEHLDLSVEYEALYQMPNPHGWAGYDDIILYRVRGSD